MQGIEIPIGAPLGQLTKDLKGADAQIKTFEKSANASLAKAGTAAGKTGKDFTGLSRVIQDLPFGFIGIQNNLTQLLPAAGALGLGISVLVAAVTFAQTGFGNWTRGLVSNKKAIDSAKLSGDEYIGTLNQVTQAAISGAQAAAQETTTLNLLYKQYTNGELALDKRKAAYDQLQKLYPAYFGNIKFEQEASDKTKSAYDRLTTSIIATARARAASDLITKNSQRQLENEQKLIDLGIALSKAKANADKIIADRQKASGGDVGDIEISNVNNTRKEAQALKEVATIQKQINDLVTDSVILRDKNLQLEKSVVTEMAKGATLTGEIGKSQAAKLEKETFARDKAITIQRLNSLDTFLAKYRKTEEEINKTPLIGFPKDINMRLAAPLDNLKNNLLPQLQSSFQTFFDDILMRGKLSFASLGKSILNTFASVLSNQVTSGLVNLLGGVGGGAAKGGKGGGLLGGIVGLLGIGGKGGAAAAGGTAATGGALLPILAGVAAVAGIASLFKKKKDVPLPAQTTQISTQASGSTYSDFSSGRVVFEISGTNLIGVLNRAGAKLQRFGP